MNATRGLLILLFVLVLIGSTTASGQSCAAGKTEFTGTETFDPFGLFGPPVGEFLSLGAVECPGFEPTGNPLQPCPLGSRVHLRGFKLFSRLNSADPRVSGWFTVEGNANWDAESTGPAWGTYSLAVDAGGTWEGTWQGRRMQENGSWVSVLHGSGQATGGAVDGMQMILVEGIVSYTASPVAYFGTIEGRILDPHSK